MTARLAIALTTLTLATAEVMVGDTHFRPVLVAIMEEVRAVAEHFGIAFDSDIETRIERAGIIGAHKTSMLQDLEAGRPMEIEALVGAVLELGKITSTPAPSIAAVYACVKLLNKILILEKAGVRVSRAA